MAKDAYQQKTSLLRRNLISKILFILFFVFGHWNVALAGGPKKLQQSGAWATYTYVNNGEKICYALSMPIRAAPLSVRHGDNFFLITAFSSNKATLEPQFMADYPLQLNSSVKAYVTRKNKKGEPFYLFTKNSSAWLISAQEEKALIDQMRKGATLTIEALSKRGTRTEYVFSLTGLSAALRAVANCNR